MDSTGSSHPAIRFENIPVVEGNLSHINSIRQDLLSKVVKKTALELSTTSSDLLLGEALYSERLRLKRSNPNLFTSHRYKKDQRLLSQIQAGLLKSSVESDRTQLLDRILWHYAEEVGGRFNPHVYKLAIKAVPWGFNWLLNAASVQRFLPWGLTQSLQSCLHIVGEVPHLQKLSQKGTILLVPTHQSNLDSMLIGYVIYLMSLPPFAYGAGLNLFSNPVLSFFMSNLGAYTVDRQKNNLIYKHLLKNYSTQLLREGIHSIFFPGGGRSRSGAIETKLKLGLLGTALQAQLQNLIAGRNNPNVYVVPMVTSTHFVLEAASLIEDHLMESGKHRFIIMDDESWQTKKIFNFFWKLFSSRSHFTVRIGRPLDVFGNFVDEEGRSMGPNQTTIDPARWLTTRGELRNEPDRDQEYTRELGNKLVERFHKENTVLNSHLVAFSFFEALRGKYPDLDLYRFLRISLPQRTLSLDFFIPFVRGVHQKLLDLSKCGGLHLSEPLKNSDPLSWIKDGIQNLGLMHDAAVLKIHNGSIWTEDMNLLYFYRNRLSGYGLEVKSK